MCNMLVDLAVDLNEWVYFIMMGHDIHKKIFMDKKNECLSVAPVNAFYLCFLPTESQNYI